MTYRAIRAALAATLLVSATGLAFAHPSLTPKTAENGTAVRLAITVPHGCEGEPTTDISVKLPEGFVSAKPLHKPGWDIEITKGPYAKTYMMHGSKVSEGPTEIHWSGGSFPDSEFDEFVVRGTLQGFEADTALPFPVTQKCGSVSVLWTEIATPGEDAPALKHPAPLFKVTVAAGADAMTMPMHTGAPVMLGDLALSGGFTRATLPNAPVGGGFLTIANHGAAADRLVSAASPAAGKVELHEMKMDGDVMKMNELADGIEIPAGGTVTLAPGGLHIMFMALKQAFVEGETIPVTLTFEKAGTVDVLLQVGPVGATGAPKHMGHS